MESARIVSSEAFLRSERQQRFLRFIVEEAIAGRDLNEYRIATEVYRRKPSFDPATDSIYETGTLASVLQLLKLPDGTVKVLVEGAARARVEQYTSRVEYYEANALVLGDSDGEQVEAEALAR